MTDPLSLPRDEDVEEFEIGGKHVSVVRLTDENRPATLEVAFLCTWVNRANIVYACTKLLMI